MKEIAVAKTFEQKEIEREEREKKNAIRAAFAFFIISVLLAIAIIVMLPLKNTEVAIFSVDKQTGRSEKITQGDSETLTQDLALSKYFTSQYISLREGYNYFRLQHDYDTVLLYGTEEVNKAYLQWYDSAESPDKVYKGAAYTADTNFITTPFIESSSQPDNPDRLATTRIEKRIRDVATGSVSIETWVIRMTYRFMPQEKLSEEDRMKNPLGFKVTSYQRQQEIRSKE